MRNPSGLWAHTRHQRLYFAGVYTEGDPKNDNTGYKGEGRLRAVVSYNVDAWTFLAGYNFKEAEKVCRRFLRRHG